MLLPGHSQCPHSLSSMVDGIREQRLFGSQALKTHRQAVQLKSHALMHIELQSQFKCCSGSYLWNPSRLRLCCSEECAKAVQQLAEGLGHEEQVVLRWEVVRRREGYAKSKGAPAGLASHGRAKTRARKPDFAAGNSETPIMLADIKVLLQYLPSLRGPPGLLMRDTVEGGLTLAQMAVTAHASRPEHANPHVWPCSRDPPETLHIILMTSDAVAQERNSSANIGNPQQNGHSPLQSEISLAQASDAVEGYVPRHPKTAPDRAKKVRFASTTRKHDSPPSAASVSQALQQLSLNYPSLLRPPNPNAHAQEAFDIIPIQGNSANPSEPSIEDLLDEAQALRREQTTPTPSPGTPARLPSSQNSAPRGNQPQRQRPNSSRSHSLPGTISNGPSEGHAEVAFQSGTVPTSRVLHGEDADSEEGSMSGSELQDRWDDYGVLEDSDLGSATAGPSLHLNDEASDGSDPHPFSQHDNAVGAQPISDTARHLQASRDVASRQGRVVERPSPNGHHQPANSDPSGLAAASALRPGESRLFESSQPTRCAANAKPTIPFFHWLYQVLTFCPFGKCQLPQACSDLLVHWLLGVDGAILSHIKPIFCWKVFSSYPH